MEKRAFIAVVLSLLVLLGYQEWISRYYGAPVPPPSPAKEVKGEPEKIAASAPALSPELASSAPVKVPASQAAKEIQVETDNYVAVFTSQGARLKSFKFKHYRSSVDENSPPLEIVTSVADVPLPLVVRWEGSAPYEDKELLYGIEGHDLKLSDASKGTLVFRGRAPNGFIVSKSFTFSGSSYPIELEVSVKAADANAPVPEILLTEKSDHTVPKPDAKFEGVIALV